MPARPSGAPARWIWIAARLLVAAALAGLWHVLVFELLRDSPGTFGLLLVGIFALVVALGRSAGRLPAAERGPLARAAARLDGPWIVLVAASLALVFLFHWGFERAASDGREYYVQVRSLVIDHDLSFDNDNAAFGTRGTARRYAFGAAILWSPFFLLCHLWLAVSNALGTDAARDGYSVYYQRAVGVGTLVYGIAGLALMLAIVRDYFARWLSLAGTLIVCFGSFIVWYLVIENSMVHGVSMFAVTLFFFTWQRARRRDRALDWAVVGAASGLMTMVRWQNGLFLIVPAAEMVLRGWSAWGDRRVRVLLQRGALFASMATASFFPQLLFWRLVYGRWWNLPSNEHGVHWSSLATADVLFSSNHGLLTTTPVLFFALVGLPLFVARDRWLATALVLGLAAQIYVNGAVEVWWGGAGFGGRRFANCALAFAVGISSLLEWLGRRPWVAPVVAVMSFLALNAAVMLDLKGGRWPSTAAITYDEMNDALYGRLGSPFSLIVGAPIAWKYGVGLSYYDQLRGSTYNNMPIDVGSEGDERFLGRGWSNRELGPGMTFRWANDREAIVVVPLKESDDYRLDFRGAPFSYPGGPPQTVRVVVNGIEAGRVVMTTDLSAYAVQIPARAIGPGLNQFRFEFDYAVSPSSVGLSGDTRTLAVLFDDIRLTRLLTHAAR